MTMQNKGREGYNLAQLQMIIQNVAAQLVSLNEVLQMAQSCDEDWERTCLVNAAQLMAQGVGCLADDALGGLIIGGVGVWHCGPALNSAGGACND